MVRFHWHVEAGLSAFSAGQQTITDEESGCSLYQIPMQVELAGQKDTFEASLTIRSTYLQAGADMPSLGIAIAHDTALETWNGKLLARLTSKLAAQGFVVMRYLAGTFAKDVRRYRLFEKALDALATSPYARAVNRWVLAGLGNGARIATVVAARCRGSIVGLALLSYPLLQPLPPAKTSKASKADPTLTFPTSEGPLLKVRAPVLFVCGSRDPLCPRPALDELRQRLECSSDAMVLDDLDACFVLPSEGAEPSDAIVGRICGAIFAFVQARNAEDTPHPPPPPQPERSELTANGGRHAGPEGGHGSAEQQTQGEDADMEEVHEAPADERVQPLCTLDPGSEQPATEMPRDAEQRPPCTEVLSMVHSG